MSGRTGQTSDAAARVGDTASMRSAAPTQQRQRNDGDEIVTTGLEVGSAYGARRRRLHPQSYAHLHTQHPTSVANQAVQAGACSSQEEYDETESEEDHVLTSSTENITSSHVNRGTPLRQVFPAQHVDSDSSDEDDDDENATALGRQPSEPFRPQPNAFSHPPSHLLQRHSTSSSIPQHASRPSFNQRSNTRVERRTPNFMSPSYQADNDAALRASLTTLLSCAAAARARPKEDEKEMGECSGPAGSNQPVELRFVPESELMAPSPPPTRSRGPSQSPRGTPSSPLPREAARGENIKRAATPTSGSKSPRAAKKKKTAALAGEDTLISPTLLTWVVSAGVVVLVSVVGFGAGYVIGREVGRQETLGGFGGAGNMSVAADGGSCGREVIRSSGGTLKRFRWGTGMGRSIAA